MHGLILISDPPPGSNSLTRSLNLFFATLAPAFALAPTAPARTQTVTLHTSVSETFLAYVAGPENAQPLFNQGRTYDPVAAAVAWEVTESYLKRRLR